MNRKKLIASLLVVFMLFTMVPTAAFAAEDSKRIEMQIGNHYITVDGESFYNDVAPTLMGDRTLVPIRVIIEAVGGTVDWDGDTRTVTITIGDKVLKLVIDEEIPGYGMGAIIMDERTFVPLRYIMEAIGAHVQWIGETQQIIITFGEGAQEAAAVTVTFDYNYSGKGNDTVTVPTGSTVERPDTPERSGYVFHGWYTDEDIKDGEVFDFSDKVYADMTLYGQWSAQQSGGSSTPSHVHEWVEGDILIEPSCEEPGEQEYTCTCGATKVEALSVLAHTFSEEWTTSTGSSYHWHPAICGHDVISDKEPHNYGENSDCTQAATCTVCSYVKPAGEHTWGDWKEDNDQHIRKCGACSAAESQAHNFDNQPWVNSDAAQHWHKCADCDAIDTKEDHSFGQWVEIPDTIQHKATCECGASITAEHEYVYIHVDGTENEDAKHIGTCSECSATTGNINCSYTKFEYDGADTHAHSATCELCEHPISKPCEFGAWEHSNEDATEVHHKTCTVCGHTHKAIAEYDKGESYVVADGFHYHKCVCGTIIKHEGSENTSAALVDNGDGTGTAYDSLSEAITANNGTGRIVIVMDDMDSSITIDEGTDVLINPNNKVVKLEYEDVDDIHILANDTRTLAEGSSVTVDGGTKNGMDVIFDDMADDRTHLVVAAATKDVTEAEKTVTYMDVYNKNGLEKFGEKVNTGENEFVGGTVTLMNDIDLGNEKWSAVGSYSTGKYFKGTLDGENHTISNLNVGDGSASDQGLIGATNGTVNVKNLTINNANVKTSVRGAVLVGHAPGGTLNVTGVTITGLVQVHGKSGQVGTIVGSGANCACTASNITVNVDTGSYISDEGHTSGMDYVGGVFGQVWGSSYTNISSNIDVIGQFGRGVGGVFGGVAGNVENVTSTGSVRVLTKNTGIAYGEVYYWQQTGLISGHSGNNTAVTFKNCKASGTLTYVDDNTNTNGLTLYDSNGVDVNKNRFGASRSVGNSNITIVDSSSGN